MDAYAKLEILHKAKQKVSKISLKMTDEIASILPIIERLSLSLKKSASYQRDIDEQIYNTRVEEKRIYEEIKKSPYFVRCDVKLQGEEDIKKLYFGKFSLKDETIYSWVAPASTIRFENPGEFTYLNNEGDEIKGMLYRKDNFMIVDSTILFMSTESIDAPRQLIYQEHFTKQKTEFVLPEIVEQMEKAQDKIIRAHHIGSYLISGPAGSGKTTLALHRVAYLMKSPDTEKLYPSYKCMVFVQDKYTQKYFSSLLPELGITNVSVTTFDAWAFELLGLKNVNYRAAYIEKETIRDAYENAKNTALNNIAGYMFEKDIFHFLYYIYRDYMSPAQLSLFLKQSSEHVIDRFDLAALLKTKKQEHGELLHKAPSYRRMKNGKYTRTFVDEPLKYSLIVIDEAENYLKENIELIKSCVDKKTQSIIYVGDLAQQTLTHTIRDWRDVNEQFTDERVVKLSKVYRNTKQILTFISNLGYNVEVSNNLKEGAPVYEHLCNTKHEELQKVTSLIAEIESGVIGIIAKHESYLPEFKERFKHTKNVFVMTINEAQGVEFDTVFLVGITEELFANRAQNPERKKVDHDLLYVALTRAMNKLHILGSQRIKDVLSTNE